MINNSVTHLRSYTNTTIADIARNSVPISPITLCEYWCHRAERRCLRDERRYRRIAWRVFKCFMMFHNVLRVFHDVIQCFKRVSWCFTSGSWFLLVVHNVLRCITMFYKVFHDVLLCLTIFSESRIGGRRSPQGMQQWGVAITLQGAAMMLQGSAITPQKSAMTPQGSSILPRKWSHAKLCPEWRLESPLEFFFKEQSYSSLHSVRSLAWDHVCSGIDDPCGAIADFCGVITDPCAIVTPWSDRQPRGRRCGNTDRCATR